MDRVPTCLHMGPCLHVFGPGTSLGLLWAWSKSSSGQIKVWNPTNSIQDAVKVFNQPKVIFKFVDEPEKKEWQKIEDVVINWMQYNVEKFRKIKIQNSSCINQDLLIISYNLIFKLSKIRMYHTHRKLLWIMWSYVLNYNYYLYYRHLWGS